MHDKGEKSYISVPTDDMMSFVLEVQIKQSILRGYDLKQTVPGQKWGKKIEAKMLKKGKKCY